MTSYKMREHKHLSDGSVVTLVQDIAAHGWFVGHFGDPALDPIPLGAFCSREAARHYADRHFAGGVWIPARRHERARKYWTGHGASAPG